MSIKLLPEGVWSRIAAGEVVERPSSAVKEMIENSMDAGAKRIRVKLWDGGRVRIVVEDDGAGIAFDELPLALTRHATSKIDGIDDLEAIHTLGYRGEALASLAAVAKVEIRSRPSVGNGGLIRAYEGRISDHVETNCSPGTRVQVDELFANLPARRKFLKSAAGELRRVASMGVAAFIESQLAPEHLEEPTALTSALAALPTESMDTVRLFREFGPSADAGGKPDPEALRRTFDRAGQAALEAARRRFR